MTSEIETASLQNQLRNNKLRRQVRCSSKYLCGELHLLPVLLSDEQCGTVISKSEPDRNLAHIIAL
jgi:hypothetical protein